MPQRSTDFQKLILLIESLRSKDATVRESHMLSDRQSSQKREVDITISSKVGDHDIIVSIEVIEHERPGDIQWVEQQLMKHSTLPTNKLILVSKSGFTKSAQDKALLHGAETLTIDSVSKHSFGFNDGELMNMRMNFTLLVVYLIFGDEKIFLSNKKLKCKAAGHEFDLYDFAGRIIGTQINSKEFFDKSPLNHRLDFCIHFPQSDYPVIFTYKKPYIVDSGISLQGYFKKFTVPILCQTGLYKKNNILMASSISDSLDEKLIVVLPEVGLPGKAIFTVHGEEVEFELPAKSSELTAP